MWVSGSITANGGPHSLVSATTIDIDSEGALTLDGGSIGIGTDADVAVTIESSTLDIDASGVVGIDSDGVMTLGAASFDIDADGGAIAIDATGAITFNGSYVDVETIRFTGDNIGLSGDTDLLVLSSGLVTLNGSLKINDDANIGIDADSDLLTLSNGQLTVAGETETTTLDVNGIATIAGNITLDKTNAQTITHTGASGNLTISSTNGDVVIENTTFSGNNLTVPGNLTVNGTETIVNSTTLEIGDRVVVLNTAGASGDGGTVSYTHLTLLTNREV